MKLRALVSFIILLAFLPACALAPAQSLTPDINATAQAAVDATLAAHDSVQATIDGAVQQTAAAQPAPAPSVTPLPNDVVANMTEEELASLIDQSVQDAMAASEQVSAATTSATTDDAITEEEVATIESELDEAEELLYAVEDLMALYLELYGEYGTEAVTVLYDIEDDLEVIADSLSEISQIMTEGAEAASAAIEQLDQAAQTAAQNIDAAQTQMQGWQEKVTSNLISREEMMLAVAPDNVASDRAGALDQTQAYITALRGAIEDNKISPTELENIAQLGANASASLNAAGGQLSDLSGKINDFTRLAARGKSAQIGAGLAGFESQLPAVRR